MLVTKEVLPLIDLWLSGATFSAGMADLLLRGNRGRAVFSLCVSAGLLLAAYMVTLA